MTINPEQLLQYKKCLELLYPSSVKSRLDIPKLISPQPVNFILANHDPAELFLIGLQKCKTTALFIQFQTMLLSQRTFKFEKYYCSLYCSRFPQAIDRFYSSPFPITLISDQFFYVYNILEGRIFSLFSYFKLQLRAQLILLLSSKTSSLCSSFMRLSMALVDYSSSSKTLILSSLVSILCRKPEVIFSSSLILLSSSSFLHRSKINQSQLFEGCFVSILCFLSNIYFWTKANRSTSRSFFCNFYFRERIYASKLQFIYFSFVISVLSSKIYSSNSSSFLLLSSKAFVQLFMILLYYSYLVLRLSIISSLDCCFSNSYLFLRRLFLFSLHSFLLNLDFQTASLFIESNYASRSWIFFSRNLTDLQLLLIANPKYKYIRYIGENSNKYFLHL